MNEGGAGHIWIDEQISEETHERVKKELTALAGRNPIVLHIYSPGGDVYAGYGIYNALTKAKSQGKKIETIIEGKAESMATMIALAGDVVKICNPSTWMIHMPRMGVHGTAESFEQGASELRGIENVMIARYAEKTGLPPEQIREMMRKETAMSAVQAQQMGFADEILGSYQQAVALGQTIEKLKQPKQDSHQAKLKQIIAMAADALTD